MRFKNVFLAVALVAAPSFASAHDQAKGVNGGQVVDDAGHHVEFTSKGGEIALFLTDESDKPISAAKATGRIIIQEGAKQSAADLTVMESNMLMAKLAAPLSAGAKLAVTIKLADGHDVKARFVLK